MATNPLQLPCRTVNADLFFTDSATHNENAKRLCHTCPLMTICREEALQRREPWGVWGGLTTEERNALLRARDTLTDPKTPHREQVSAA